MSTAYRRMYLMAVLANGMTEENNDTQTFYCNNLLPDNENLLLLIKKWVIFRVLL